MDFSLHFPEVCDDSSYHSMEYFCFKGSGALPNCEGSGWRTGLKYDFSLLGMIEMKLFYQECW